jgi:methylated-DNA-[protein]-cysteine S-methyltransferase
MRTKTLHATPVGRLTLIAQDGALSGIYFPDHRGAPSLEAVSDPLDPILRAACDQLDQYFAGTRFSFDLPLAAAGAPFQRRVWSQLRAIPLGQTRSYGAVARELGVPGAGRAVGAANARNPISIVVPCHRVIGSDGSPTGYAGGLAAKEWLLAHERRLASSRVELSEGVAPG